MTRNSYKRTAAVPSLKTAEQLYRDGQLDAAEFALRTILKMEPRNQEARYYLTLVHRSEAANLQPKSPKPRFYCQTIPQQPIY